MTEGQDILFRVRVHTAYDNGSTYTTFKGPYMTLGPARSMVTRTKNDVGRYGRKSSQTEVTLEACMPEWKVME